MPRFTGVDFYEIDSLLQEDEIQIRGHVRDWVEERYLPLIEDAYEKAYFPTDVIPELAEMGLLGASLPEKYGCAGVSGTRACARSHRCRALSSCTRSTRTAPRSSA